MEVAWPRRCEIFLWKQYFRGGGGGGGDVQECLKWCYHLQTATAKMLQRERDSLQEGRLRHPVWPGRNWQFLGFAAKFCYLKNDLPYWAGSDAAFPTVSSRAPHYNKTIGMLFST